MSKPLTRVVHLPPKTCTKTRIILAFKEQGNLGSYFSLVQEHGTTIHKEESQAWGAD